MERRRVTRQWFCWWDLIHLSEVGPIVPMMLDGVARSPKAHVCSLVVLLLLDGQVAMVARWSADHQLRQLRPFWEQRDLATVTPALVLTSKLNYSNMFCVGLLLKTVRELQRMQNAGARLLTGQRHDHFARITLAPSPF